MCPLGRRQGAGERRGHVDLRPHGRRRDGQHITENPLSKRLELQDLVGRPVVVCADFRLPSRCQPRDPLGRGDDGVPHGQSGLRLEGHEGHEHHHLHLHREKHRHRDRAVHAHTRLHPHQHDLQIWRRWQRLQGRLGQDQGIRRVGGERRRPQQRDIGELYRVGGRRRAGRLHPVLGSLRDNRHRGHGRRFIEQRPCQQDRRDHPLPGHLCHSHVAVRKDYEQRGARRTGAIRRPHRLQHHGREQGQHGYEDGRRARLHSCRRGIRLRRHAQPRRQLRLGKQICQLEKPDRARGRLD